MNIIAAMGKLRKDLDTYNNNPNEENWQKVKDIYYLNVFTGEKTPIKPKHKN